MTDPPTPTTEAPEDAEAPPPATEPDPPPTPIEAEPAIDDAGGDAMETRLAEAQTELAALRGELDAARQQLQRTERRQRIDQLLIESDAIDLQAARLLTEAAIAEMDDADVAAVVDDLRRHKPYLFRRREEAGAMSPRPRGAEPSDEAAAHAAATGDRRDLLRYLRLRRATA